MIITSRAIVVMFERLLILFCASILHTLNLYMISFQVSRICTSVPDDWELLWYFGLEILWIFLLGFILLANLFFCMNGFHVDTTLKYYYLR